MAFCSNCGVQNVDGALFCGNCGASLQQVNPAPNPNNPNQPPVKKSKARILVPVIGATVLLLVVAVVVAGSLTNWFGFASPMNKLLKATVNTLEAENASVKATLEVDDTKLELDGSYVLDFDNENVAALVDLSYEDGKHGEGRSL